MKIRQRWMVGAEQYEHLREFDDEMVFNLASPPADPDGNALLLRLAAVREMASDPPTMVTNETSIGDALLAALLSNQQAITTLNAWVAANPGTLSTAQLSAAMRTAANNQVAQFRQLNGLIRLVKRQLSTADLNSALKAAPTV